MPHHEDDDYAACVQHGRVGCRICDPGLALDADTPVKSDDPIDGPREDLVKMRDDLLPVPELPQIATRDIELVRQYLFQDERSRYQHPAMPVKVCPQCAMRVGAGAGCVACTIGEPHFNETDIKSGSLSTVAAHNAKGHHHVLWNGATNITVECGSPVCNQLAANILLHRLEVLAPIVTSANARQVGGSHYGLSARQHWDVVIEFDLDYFQSVITKYLFRWDKKNGVEDLKKAQHYLEKYIEEIEAGRILMRTARKEIPRG